MNSQREENDRGIHLVTIGETVIDLVSDDFVDSLKNAFSFKRYFGGSPANIAINIQNLGFTSAIITRLGEDALGKFAFDFIQRNNVNTSGIQWDKQHRTSMIIVGRNKGTPDALHYRDADKYLTFTENARSLIDKARIVHFSGLALSGETSRETLYEIKNYVMKKKEIERIRRLKGEKIFETIITFDPCFDEIIWDDPIQGREVFEDFITGFDLIKPSKDDMKRLWGEIEPEKAVDKYHKLGAKNILLTMGELGVLFYDGYKLEHLQQTPVEVVDATGAGDSLWAGTLAWLLYEEELNCSPGQNWELADTILTGNSSYKVTTDNHMVGVENCEGNVKDISRKREGNLQIMHMVQPNNEREISKGSNCLSRDRLLQATRKGMQAASFTVQYSGAIAPLNKIRNKLYKNQL